MATLDSKTEKHTLTLEKGKTGFVAFMSPEKDDKFKKQYNYFVTLMDTDGKPLTKRQGFTVAETVAAGRARVVDSKK